jgi:two-component system response regulator PhoP
MRILLVEDEQVLRTQLQEFLSTKDFLIDPAPNAEIGLEYGLQYPIDVAIIDLGLPGMSGFELIRALRSRGKRFPILILTARDRWQDKVEGLDAGADDYMVKPFHIEELCARIHALHRRVVGWGENCLQSGDIQLYLASQRVEVRQQELKLTAYEYKLLEYFMTHPAQIISKMELTEFLYQQDFDRDSNVLEVLIGRLRKKIDPQAERYIETLRGKGYRFCADVVQLDPSAH